MNIDEHPNIVLFDYGCCSAGEEWFDWFRYGYVEMGMGEKLQIQGTTYSIRCCFKVHNVPCLFLGRAVADVIAWLDGPWIETCWNHGPTYGWCHPVILRCSSVGLAPNMSSVAPDASEASRRGGVRRMFLQIQSLARERRGLRRFSWSGCFFSAWVGGLSHPQNSSRSKLPGARESLRCECERCSFATEQGRSWASFFSRSEFGICKHRNG